MKNIYIAYMISKVLYQMPSIGCFIPDSINKISDISKYISEEVRLDSYHMKYI